MRLRSARHLTRWWSPPPGLLSGLHSSAIQRKAPHPGVAAANGAFRNCIAASDARLLPEAQRCPAGCSGTLFASDARNEDGSAGGTFTVGELFKACYDMSQTPEARASDLRFHVRTAESVDGAFVDAGRFYTHASTDGTLPVVGVERDLPLEQQLSKATVCSYAAVRSMSKADCWHLARFRREPFTGPALWKRTLKDLQTLVKLPTGARWDSAEHLTPYEEASLSAAQAKRQAATGKYGTTTEQLKMQMQERGISVSAGMTKDGMIDALVCDAERATTSRLPSLADLDPLQRDAVEWGAAIAQGRLTNDDKALCELLISAGPGAGKTATVVNLIAEVVKRTPAARVLVLVFNVEAESTLNKRLGQFGLRRGSGLIPKTKARDPNHTGCCVLTFDKMAHQVCTAFTTTAYGANTDFQTLSYRDGKEQAAIHLRHAANRRNPTKPGVANWDVIIVDEAQDVTALEANIVEGLMQVGRAVGATPGLIAAGDPRQEVYPGATWYSGRWSAVQSGTTDTRRRSHVLSNNYRSAPEIVAALNAYSRAAFPTLHHDQVAVRTDPGKVSIIEVQGLTSGVDQNIGRQVGELLAARPPGESYGLVPVSLEKFGVGGATTAARQALHELQPSELTLALTGRTTIPDGDVYLLATAQRIKGTERRLVVAYAADRDYDLVIDPGLMAKLMFVTLSRAQDELVLVTQKLARQRIKVLIEPFIAANLLSGGAGVVTADPVEQPRRQELKPVPVTGETLSGGGGGAAVCQIPYTHPLPWTTETHHLTPLTPDDEFSGAGSETQRDFIGCLAEAHMARAMQMEWLRLQKPGTKARIPALASPLDLQITIDRDRDNHGLYQTVEGSLTAGDSHQGGYVLCTSADNKKQLESLIAETAATCASETDAIAAAAPYVHAMLNFTALCGRPWTVSSNLADPSLNSQVGYHARIAAHTLAALLTALSSSGESSQPEFWVRRKYTMSPCRPGALHPRKEMTAMFKDSKVSFECDAIVGGVPVEFKYTNELSDEHERQLYSYMVMVQSTVGVLFNGRTGECRVLRSRPNRPKRGAEAEYMCRARALLALRTSRSASLRHLAPHAITPPAMLRGTGDGGISFTTAISVDTETENGFVTEIGAVAISLADWSILGTFQERVPCTVVPQVGRDSVVAGPFGRDFFEGLTGLRRTATTWDAAGTQSHALEQDFKVWCQEMSSVPAVYLHWAGSEKQLLGEHAATLDIFSSCFVPWLELKRGGGAGVKARQGSTDLGSAMQQLLPHVPFVSHCAFEDALATLAVLMATVNTGSKL